MRVLYRPLRGTFAIIRRLHAKDEYQVRPYVFLFLSFSLFAVVPRLVTELATTNHKFDPETFDISPYAVRMHSAYDAIANLFEPKQLVVLLLACIAGVSVYDLTTRSLSLLARGTHIRRLLFREAMFYVGGVECLLLSAALIPQAFHLSGYPKGALTLLTEAWTSLEFETLLPQWRHHLWSDPNLYLSVVIPMLLIGIVLPLAIRFRRYRTPKQGQSKAWKFHSAILSALLAVGCVAAILSSCMSAAYLDESLEPRPKYYFLISDVHCELNEQDKNISGLFVISNVTTDPWLFESDDFKIGVRRDKTPEELIRPSRFKNTRISKTSEGVVVFGKDEQTAYLVESGRSAWFSITAKNSGALIDFLAAGKDTNGITKCFVRYDNTDVPIEDEGYLVTDADRAKKQ
jgi:hypothetical protein